MFLAYLSQGGFSAHGNYLSCQSKDFFGLSGCILSQDLGFSWDQSSQKELFQGKRWAKVRGEFRGPSAVQIYYPGHEDGRYMVQVPQVEPQPPPHPFHDLYILSRP